MRVLVGFLQKNAVWFVSGLIAVIGFLIKYYGAKRREKAAVVSIEEQNTDIIINRLAADNKALMEERKELRDDNKKLREENDNLHEQNEQLLDELHQLKIKIAELTNEVTRLEAALR